MSPALTFVPALAEQNSHAEQKSTLQLLPPRLESSQSESDQSETRQEQGNVGQAPQQATPDLVRDNSYRAMNAVPSKTATYRGVQSTLEMQPVAGPIFGRNFRNGQPLFRLRNSQQNSSQTQQHRHTAPQHNLRQPAVPSLPPSTEPTPRVAQQPLRQTESDLRSTNTDGWKSRNGAPTLSPLRDPGNRSLAPNYAKTPDPIDRQQTIAPSENTIDAWVREQFPGEEPGPVASTLELKARQPAADPPSLAPPRNEPLEKIAIEPRNSTLRLESSPEPLLVSPTAPSINAPMVEELADQEMDLPAIEPTLTLKKAFDVEAEGAEEPSLRKAVPSADVETRSVAKDIVPEGIRRELDIESKRQIDLLEQESQVETPKVAARSKIDARSESTTSRESRSISDSNTSRSRQARVGDIDETPTQSITLDYVGMPSQPIDVSPYVQRMKPAMSRVLQYFYDRPEVAAGRSNWGMMHAIMVYGVDTRCAVGNRSFSTIAWIAGNNICRGQKLLTQERGRIKVKSGVGLQGHQAQMLAVFSLCDVPANYPVYADNVRFSMQDVIEEEKLACKSGEELTFTLIGLSHYMDTDAQWIAADGQRWDFERLIREELTQPIVGAACGGTHRLMGYAHALRNRRAEGKPMTGQWARAEQYVQDFVNYTYQLQNRDGSMSTNWYEGRGDSGDVDRKIQTTGHMVEFLLTTTPDSQLQDPRLVRAIAFLANSLNRDLSHDWKIGPKGHALRSLAMYHDRVFKSGSAYRTQAVAQGASPQGNYR
ncbi:MAG: hypothetical protein WBD20_25155 [Pirellulaceae bacterium]